MNRTALSTPLLALSLALAAVDVPQAVPARAQSSWPQNEVRALNFARNYAVRLNGGLTVYRPQACMFTTSAATNPCRIRSDANGFTFRFLGGPPAWQVEGRPATLETELTVAADGTRLVRLIYNGPPRSPQPQG